MRQLNLFSTKIFLKEFLNIFKEKLWEKVFKNALSFK